MYQILIYDLHAKRSCLVSIFISDEAKLNKLIDRRLADKLKMIEYIEKQLELLQRQQTKIKVLDGKIQCIRAFQNDDSAA